VIDDDLGRSGAGRKTAGLREALFPPEFRAAPRMGKPRP
jgi:hypothetical protein